MKTTAQKKLAAFRITLDSNGVVRIMPVEIVKLDNILKVAKVMLIENGARTEISKQVPYENLASTRGKAVVIALKFLEQAAKLTTDDAKQGRPEQGKTTPAPASIEQSQPCTNAPASSVNPLSLPLAANPTPQC
jgi:hypothetical protein